MRTLDIERNRRDEYLHLMLLKYIPRLETFAYTFSRSRACKDSECTLPLVKHPIDVVKLDPIFIRALVSLRRVDCLPYLDLDYRHQRTVD